MKTTKTRFRNLAPDPANDGVGTVNIGHKVNYDRVPY